MREENAKITSTYLGLEDRGIFTAVLSLEGDGWVQSFGGKSYGNQSSNGVQDTNLATFIRQMLAVVGVKSWEDLKGKMVRIRRESDDDKISQLGHIMESR